MRDASQTLNQVTERIIGAAIEVHRAIGPGLLESAYEECMAREMTMRGLRFQRQKPLPICYQGALLDCGYRLDFLIEDTVVVELKVVQAIHPIHEAQLLSYLKLGGWRAGLLINFHSTLLTRGIKRMILDRDRTSVLSATPR